MLECICKYFQIGLKPRLVYWSAKKSGKSLFISTLLAILIAYILEWPFRRPVTASELLEYRYSIIT